MITITYICVNWIILISTKYTCALFIETTLVIIAKSFGGVPCLLSNDCWNFDYMIREIIDYVNYLICLTKLGF